MGFTYASHFRPLANTETGVQQTAELQTAVSAVTDAAITIPKCTSLHNDKSTHQKEGEGPHINKSMMQREETANFTTACLLGRKRAGTCIPSGKIT